MRDTVATKKGLRARLLAARRAMSAQERARAGAALREAVLARPEAEMAGTVAAYLSTEHEPDTRGLVFALWKRGTYVLLPVLLPSGDLDWGAYDGPDTLAPGPHGLLQPATDRRGVAAVRSADLVLVPALAVDRRGWRLGRGGGSYDRVLARLHPAMLTIALVYDDELVDSVPVEAHDRRVRAVVTPSGGFRTLPLTGDENTGM